MSTLAYVTCPACEKPVPVKANGKPRAHHIDGDRCPAIAEQSLGLPWTTPLTQNQVRRMHPLKEAAIKKRLSTEARWIIRAAKLKPVDRADVVLHYRPATRRICDADGLAPALKVSLDALVREHILPADDWRHVPFAGCRIHPPLPGMPSGMWLTLTEPREDA